MGQSVYEARTVVPVVPNDGAIHIIAQVPAQVPGCFRATAKIKFIDNVTGNIGTIAFALTVQGGTVALPIQVGGTENPSSLHTNIPNPPSSSMVVTLATGTIDVRLTNPVAGNPVRAAVIVDVEYLP